MIFNKNVDASGGQLFEKSWTKTFDKARDKDDAKRRDGPKGLLWFPAPRGCKSLIKTFDNSRDQDDAKRRDGTKCLLRLPAPRGGKVLRVKQGYNPNSSSMGSIVFVLPATFFVIAVIFGALSGLLAPFLMRKVENPGKKIEQFYSRMQNNFFKKKMKDPKQ